MPQGTPGLGFTEESLFDATSCQGLSTCCLCFESSLTKSPVYYNSHVNTPDQKTRSQWMYSDLLINSSSQWIEVKVKWSESHSVMSDSLWPYSPWNSPGQNTGVGSCSLLQGIFQPRDGTQVSSSAGGFFASWVTREAHSIKVLSAQYQTVFWFVLSQS